MYKNLPLAQVFRTLEDYHISSDSGEAEFAIRFPCHLSKYITSNKIKDHLEFPRKHENPIYWGPPCIWKI